MKLISIATVANPDDIDVDAMIHNLKERYKGSPIIQSTIEDLRHEARSIRQKWLYQNPGFIADGDVCVSVNGGNVSVKADVISIQAQSEREYNYRMRMELLEELDKKNKADDAEMARREANMQRLLRKLLRLHADARSPAIMSIWDTLSEGQQYAIMKDIDYRERHK